MAKSVESPHPFMAVENPPMASVTCCGHRELAAGNLGTISKLPSWLTDLSTRSNLPGSDAAPTSKGAPEDATLPGGGPVSCYGRIHGPI
jgi:hypothetical protein